MRHGSKLDPPNRFERTHREDDLEQVAWDDEYLNDRSKRQNEYVGEA